MNILKLKQLINTMKNRIFLDSYQKEYITFNEKNIKDTNNKFINSVNEILIEQTIMQPFIFGLSYLSNVLADKYEAKILSFGNYGKMRDYSTEKIYKSFNVLNNIYDDKILNKEILSVIKKEFNSIKTKNDLLNYDYKGLNIGVDVYSTYLRVYDKATVDLNDNNVKRFFAKAIIMTEFWLEYFTKHKVKAVVVSHPCYIKSNIIAKVARLNKIIVYLFDGLYSLEIENVDFYQSKNFHDYLKIWNNLDEEEKITGINWAKNQLNRRFSGEVGVDMDYSKKSSFGKINYNDRVLKQTSKPKILICSHMFSDDPFCYGYFLFPDFYEWLEYLGKKSKELDYDWYIKMHPDYLKQTKLEIDKFLKKYPNIKMLNPNVSHLQLIHEGINCVLTVYGTVGCEYPLFNVPVINAGNNPHIAFSFNYNPKTISEYEEYLEKIPKSKFVCDKNEIYKFYYVHHMYGKFCSIKNTKDDLVIKSYTKLKNDLGHANLYKNSAYLQFIKHVSNHVKENFKTIIENN